MKKAVKVINYRTNLGLLQHNFTEPNVIDVNFIFIPNLPGEVAAPMNIKPGKELIS